jgi:hypothetical protein
MTMDGTMKLLARRLGLTCLVCAAVLAAGIWAHGCGHMIPVHAQNSGADPLAGTIPADKLIVLGTHYAPGEDLEALDVKVLAGAKRSIDLAAYSLTDPAIVDALAARAAGGVKIRLYLDRGELQAECRGDATCGRIALHKLIGVPGVEIRVKRSLVLMHLKSYEVDDWIVRDGSANFSEAGERRQDNSAVYETFLAQVSAFESEFSTIWSRPDNLTVAEAVQAGKPAPVTGP